MGSLVRFNVVVIRVAVVLALMGQLKGCTLQMMGLAAKKTETGVMSYTKATRMLWGPSQVRGSD